MNDNKIKILYDGGQIMVETMVALGMVVIAMLGMLSLLSSSLAINRVVADQYVASYLAGEGIEIVKNIIDSNIAAGRPFNEGLTGCNNANGCAFQYDSVGKEGGQANPDAHLTFKNGFYSYDIDGDETPFVRRVRIYDTDLNGTPGLRVVSSVTWKTRGGIENTITIEDKFYNWRQ